MAGFQSCLATNGYASLKAADAMARGVPPMEFVRRWFLQVPDDAALEISTRCWSAASANVVQPVASRGSRWDEVAKAVRGDAATHWFERVAQLRAV